MKLRIQDAQQTLMLLAVALSTAGCASVYRFEVDSVRNPLATAIPAAYRIASAHPSLREGDAAFDKVADSVRVALSSKGMYDAPEGTPHGSDIEIDFGMGRPEIERQTVREPVYIEVAQAKPVDLTQGRHGGSVMGSAPPVRQLVGYRDVERHVVIHSKFLRVTARSVPDPDAGQPPSEQWSVYVENNDESADLERYLPLMVAAGMDSIACEQATPQTVVLTDRDPRVTFVERGMDSPDSRTSDKRPERNTSQPVLVATSRVRH